MGIWRQPHRRDKKGKIRYQRIVEIYRQGRRIYKSKTFDTKRDGLEWEQKLKYEIDKGIITRESLKKRTFADAIEKYTTAVLSRREKNVRNILHHLNWWKQQIGHLQIADVTPSVLSECRDLLLNEPSPKGKLRKSGTALRYIASASVVLEHCVKEWMWIPQNPIRSIRKPSAGKGRTRFFSQEEIQKIRVGCAESGSQFLLSIFIIALHTGMRRGEILSLRWEDIDFKNKEIKLATSKNGEPRDVPMTEQVYRVLCDLAESVQLNLSGLLFSSPTNPSKPRDIKSSWERVLKKVGIEDATFHTIRHTTCSYLAQLGISPILIARIVGHKDSRTTDRYTHAVKSHIREAIGKLESLMQNGGRECSTI